jgi:hypothetical protein
MATWCRAAQPDDLPAFNREMIGAFSRVRGQARQQA